MTGLKMCSRPRRWVWVIAFLVTGKQVSMTEASQENIFVNSTEETKVVGLNGSKGLITFRLEFAAGSACSLVLQSWKPENECMKPMVSYIKKNTENGLFMVVEHFDVLKLDVTEDLISENWLQRRLRTPSVRVCCEAVRDCVLQCNATRSVRTRAGEERGKVGGEFSSLRWDLRLNRALGCVDIARRDGNAFWNLVCSKELRSAEYLVLDEVNWVLFYVVSKNKLMAVMVETGSESVVIAGEDFGNAGELNGRIAVDPVGKTVYWLTAESVNLIKYPGVPGNDGSVVPVLLHLLDRRTSNEGLAYGDGSVIWLQSRRGNPQSIVKLEKGGFEPVPVLTFENSSPEGGVIRFVIHPSVKETTPCGTAPCSHGCVQDMSRAKGYRCWCPQSLPILKKDDCKLPRIIVATSRESVPGEVVLDYAVESGEDGIGVPLFPVVEKVATTDGDNFGFTVNSRIETVCWAGGVNNPAKCKTRGGSPVVVESTNISSPKDSVVFLDFENATDTLYWSVGGCLKLSSIRNVTDKAVTLGCIDVDSLSPFRLGPFAAGIFVCNNKLGNIYTWFYVIDKLYVSTPFDVEEGKCSSIGIDYKGSVFFIHGKKVKAINSQGMLDARVPVVIWEMDYEGGHSMEFNRDHLFWIGSRGGEGDFVEMIKTDVYVKATQSFKIFQALPGTRIHGLQIFESVQRLRPDFQHCVPNKCSHYCVGTTFVRVATEDSFKCLCPEGMVLKGRFTCGEAEVEEGPGMKSSLEAVAIILPALLVLVIVFVVLHQLKKRHRIAQLSGAIQKLLDGNQQAADRARNEMEKVRYLPFTKIIPERDLVVSRNKVLGEGNFGVVYEGVYENQGVAVKTLRNCRDLEMLSEFVLELKIMAHVGTHENIVRFFGAETSKVYLGKIQVVLELCPHGSLDSYLARNGEYYTDDVVDGNADIMDAAAGRRRRPSAGILNLETLFSWARQLADGMAFLEERQVVHGDLATRNILLFEDNVIKVSDFGFARNLYQYTTYVKTKRVALPWRWGAIETLEHFEFSVKSDVWAYGVTIWEMFTLGSFPFPDEKWTLEFVENLRRGYRLPDDDVVCKRVYTDIMMKCWRINPDTRPDFKTIQEYFCR